MPRKHKKDKCQSHLFPPLLYSSIDSKAHNTEKSAGLWPVICSSKIGNYTKRYWSEFSVFTRIWGISRCFLQDSHLKEWSVSLNSSREPLTPSVSPILYECEPRMSSVFITDCWKISKVGFLKTVSWAYSIRYDGLKFPLCLLSKMGMRREADDWRSNNPLTRREKLGSFKTEWGVSHSILIFTAVSKVLQVPTALRGHWWTPSASIFTPRNWPIWTQSH